MTRDRRHVRRQPYILPPWLTAQIGHERELAAARGQRSEAASIEPLTT